MAYYPGICNGNAKHPDYLTRKARRETFGTDEEFFIRLAICGFYATGTYDCVKCFFCGICFRDLPPDQNIWFHHATDSPKCEFLKLHKGEKFIEKALYLAERDPSELDDEIDLECNDSDQMIEDLNSRASQMMMDKGYKQSDVEQAIIKAREIHGYGELKSTQIFEWLLENESINKAKRQGIVVEDLYGKQHTFYTNDVDYLVNKVEDETGISKKNFLLVYGENVVVPGKDLYIPDGAKIHLLPVKKGKKHPTDVTTVVKDVFHAIFGQLKRLFKNFPGVFEDTTRLLSEKDFVGISQLIGEGWAMLGTELGLTKVKLQHIKEDKQNVASSIFEMLSQWAQTQKDGATAGHLLNAVKKSGVSCEFDTLKRVLLVGL